MDNSRTVWRPQQQVHVKVIGVCIHAGRLLAAEVLDDAGRVKGVRPLGGHIEFGETREQALQREFTEELGTGITQHGDWMAFENLFEHEGVRGHEYLFARKVTLDDTSLCRREFIVFSEDSGAECLARWYATSDLRLGFLPVFPPALLERL